MNKYLIEILQIQNSVILPGLGALMLPSEKSNKIVFNQHLKFNDGSLAKFIAEKESIDEQEAQNQIAKFVREIEAVLGKGDSYDMFEFGRFYKNANGDIDFEMAGSAKNTDQSAPKKETAAPPKKVVPVVDIIKDPKKTSEEAPKKETKSSDKTIEKPSEKKVDKPKKEKKSSTKKPETDQKDEKKDSKQSKNEFIPVPDVSKSEVPKKEDDKSVKKEEEPPAENKKEVPAEKEKSQVEAPPKPDAPAESTSKQQKNQYIPEETQKVEEKSDKPKPASAIASAASSATKVSSEKAATKVETTKKVVKEKIVEKEDRSTGSQQPKKKKRRWLWILLLLLIGLAVAGYFFKDEIMTWFDKGQETEQTEDPATDENNDADLTDEGEDEIVEPIDSSALGMDEMMDDSASAITEENVEDATEDDVEEIDEEPVNDPEPVVTNNGSNNGSYHLIGNSFGEKSNAERYVSEMSGKGYPAKILGRFDGLYLVSLKSYDSRDAAQSGRSSVTADAGSAWIFKYPK